MAGENVFDLAALMNPQNLPGAAPAGPVPAQAPMMQPQVPAPVPPVAGAEGQFQPTPPATPEEHEARKVGWRGFFDQLQKNPHAQKMLLTIGTQMMQPIPAGQTAGGQVGLALQQGADALSASKAAAAGAAFKTRELDIKEIAAKGKAAKGSQPASEVQVLNLVAKAKIAAAKSKGQDLSMDKALLEANSERQNKSPAELLSSILPLMVLTGDTAMMETAMGLLKQMSSGDSNGTGTSPPADGTKVKRHVFNPATGKFEVK